MSFETHKPITILLADDDEDDRLLAREALAESHFEGILRCVEDGEEAMEYLQRSGRYVDAESAPRPGLVLLDLNMPRKDGREVLRELRSDPQLRRVPVIVLSTSSSDTDILESYDLGVNSFITKPTSFEGMVDVMKALRLYWVKTVQLPVLHEQP